jgi:hypothetical protein
VKILKHRIRTHDLAAKRKLSIKLRTRSKKKKLEKTRSPNEACRSTSKNRSENWLTNSYHTILIRNYAFLYISFSMASTALQNKILVQYFEIRCEELKLYKHANLPFQVLVRCLVRAREQCVHQIHDYLLTSATHNNQLTNTT